MTFSYLTALSDSIQASPTIMALVDDEIDMNLAVEQLEAHLHGSHLTCINLSMAAWNGESTGVQAIFTIEIRSRVSQEYAYQVADAIRDLIEHGFSRTYSGITYQVYVSKIMAETAAKGETPRTYKVIQTVYGSLTQVNTHSTVPAISAIVFSLSSPQTLRTSLKIKITCVACDTDGDAILYKFEHNGPATGGAWVALTVWQENNDYDWRPAEDDIGTNFFRVRVIDGYHAGKGSYDDILEALEYIINDNALPILSVLAPSLASPRVMGTGIKFIATATDADGDWLLYRFWLNGPATGGIWEDQTGWISKNTWDWTPAYKDIGSNQVRCDIIDQKHAGRSSYDATLTVPYTVSDNVLPTVAYFDAVPVSPQMAETPVQFICTVNPGDTDSILYRFTINGPGTGSVEKDMTGWQSQNNWTWTPQITDTGTTVINVYVRDGNHAGPGSYDATTHIDFVVNS
jgi:hypothetical protein